MKLRFINRVHELKRLAGFLTRRDALLACVYGRRRCGKSRLLNEALRDRTGVYYVADDREPALQRRALAHEMASLVPGFDRVEYPGWDELFDRWWADAPRGAVLVVDELPALVASSPELPSLLQKRLDRSGTAAPKMILCGSSQRMMHGLVLDGAAPLYGRAHEILKIEPMSVASTQQALGLRRAVDAVESYALWGGVPRYWELARDHKGRWQALESLVLDPMGVLHLEPDRLLQDDLRDTTQASSIMALIGGGCHRVSEIGARLGRPATDLSRPLARLVDLGFVVRETPFGASPRDAKRSFYRIADPFLSFWYRFVEPARSRLQAGHATEVAREVSQAWTDHLGLVWEDLARASVPHLRLAGQRWAQASRWWGRGTDGRDLELDIVAASSADRDHLLVAEAKVSCTAPEARRLVGELERRSARCPALQGRRLSFALFVLRPSARARNLPVIGPEEVVAAFRT